jgi:hypothetical protein
LVKGLVLVPVGMVLTALAAALILRGAGRAVPASTLITAAGIATLAAEGALIPLVLTRRAGPVGTAQAALGGSMIHLFFTFVLGAGAYLMKLVDRRDTFLFLLMSFYWISLLLVVTVMVRQVRRSAESVKASGTAAS